MMAFNCPSVISYGPGLWQSSIVTVLLKLLTIVMLVDDDTDIVDLSSIDSQA